MKNSLYFNLNISYTNIKYLHPNRLIKILELKYFYFSIPEN